MKLENEEGKALLASKTFWGTVILAASVFLPKLRVLNDDAVLTYLSGGIGVLLTLAGRMSATKQITGFVRK